MTFVKRLRSGSWSSGAVLSRALHERDDIALLLHRVIRRMVDEPARFVEIDRRLGIRAR